MRAFHQVASEKFPAITMGNEGALVCGLLLEERWLTRADDNGAFSAVLGGRGPGFVYAGERRAYAANPNGEAIDAADLPPPPPPLVQLPSPGGGAGSVKGIASHGARSALAAADNVGSGSGSISIISGGGGSHAGVGAGLGRVDPSDLLQLPPHALAATLGAIAAAVPAALAPLPPSPGSASLDVPEYSGEALVAWLVGSGTCGSAAHAMLVGNALATGGYVAQTRASSEAQFDLATAEKEAVERAAAAKGSGRGSTAGSTMPDPGMPFGDAPTLLLSQAVQAAAAAGCDGDGAPSTAPLPLPAGQRTSSPRLSLLRFTLSPAPGGRLAPPPPTPKALEELQRREAQRQQQSPPGGAGSGENGLRKKRFEATQAATEELRALERSLAAEEAALVADSAALAKDCADLGALERECRKERREAERESKDVGVARVELARHHFMLEARQVRLLADLHAIYPISPLEKDQGWAIRCLELPRDLSSGAFDDDHISSALGYVVHVTVLLSKYLQVPLRYQLVYAASRSAVRDRVASGGPGGAYGGGSGGGGGDGLGGGGGGVAFGGSGGGGGASGVLGAGVLGLDASSGGDGLQLLPLYRRSADPEKFKLAAAMLGADVEQLLLARGVRPEAMVLSLQYKLKQDAGEGGGAGGGAGVPCSGMVPGSQFPASGSDMLKNLEKLFRSEICPTLT